MPRPAAAPLSPRSVVEALAVAVIWGMGFVVAKAGAQDFPPILMQAFRFVVTALALVWVLPRPRGNWGMLLAITFIGGTVQYSLTFTGLQGMGAGLTALIVQLEVPFLVLLGALLLKERPGLRKWCGIALAFCGVVLIVRGGPFTGSVGSVLLVIGGAFTWALGQVMVRWLKGLDGWAITGWVAVLAVPQLFLASALFEHGQVAAVIHAGPRVWGAAIYLGLIMQALGYYLWNSLLVKHDVGQVAPFLLLLPVVSVLGGALFLGEAPGPGKLMGGAVVLAGVAIITLQRRPRPVEAVAGPEPALAGADLPAELAGVTPAEPPVASR